MNSNSSAVLADQDDVRDGLSEVLLDFRLAGVSYTRCDMGAPWSLHFPPEPEVLRFRYVAKGTAWLYTEANGWQLLQANDLVLLPQGTEHHLSSAEGLVDEGFSQCDVRQHGGNVFEISRSGREATTSVLFSGTMTLKSCALRPLINLMPQVIYGAEAAKRDPMVTPILAAMGEEAARPGIGSATLLSRMAEILTTRLIRCWIEHGHGTTIGWVAAIRDAHIGRTLVAMHRDPGADWTLASLSALAGQSRSVYAERFSAILGEGPASYLARLRMRLASDWLTQTQLSIAEIATRLGYESEASFARAFKRITDASPGSLRRTSGRTAIEAGY